MEYKLERANGKGSGGTTRRGALAVAGAGLPLVLAACAGGQAGPAGGTRPAGQTLRDQRLTFLHWWTDSLGPGYNTMMAWAADAFKQRTGAQVELVDGKPGGGLNEKFITMTTAGAPPDASFMSVVIGRDDYDAGMLKNLTPYVAKSPDLGDKEFFDSSKKFRTKGNETFGIPTMGPESLGFIVNSGLLDAVGLDPKGADLKTWDDLTRAAQKLTRVSGTEFQQTGLLVGNLSLSWLSAWLYSDGAQLTDPGETKYLLDVPATREVVQYSTDLINKHRVSPKLDDPGRPANARQALIAGQVAMIYDESAIGLLNAPADFRFWFIALPKGPRGSGLASSTWTNFCSVASQSKAPDGAVEWIRWFTSVEAHIGRMQAKGGTMASNPRVKLYDTPEWKKWVQENPVLGFIPEAAKLPGAYPYLRYNRIDADIAPVMKGILSGAVGVNEGLADAQKKADQIMAEPVRVQ
jgi:ABC-type glycerol-3-phosphate transport system substrate-binding protein